MLRCLERLGLVLQTENDVLLFTASGSGAFESAVVNLLSPGERVLAVSAGEFGERWARIAAAYGADVQDLRYEWGETPRAEDVRARIEETGAECLPRNPAAPAINRIEAVAYGGAGPKAALEAHPEVVPVQLDL